LIDNNHPWSSIQEYSLSEIGVFIKVIVRKEAQKKADDLSQLWLGNNLKYKALQEVIKDILASVEPKKTPEEEAAEIQNNWVRLKAFFQGRR
jgi:hypothetical protein